MKFNFKQKILFTTIVTILIFGLVATIGVFSYSKNFIFNLEKDNLNNFARQNSNLVRQIFLDIEEVSNTISRQEIILSYLQSEDLTLQDSKILSLLQTYKINDFYDVIYLMNTDGLTLVSTDESFVNQNYGFRNYFKEALAGRQNLDTSLGVTSQKLGYYMASPIFGDRDVVLGVVVIKIKPQILDNLANAVNYSKDSHIMVLDRFGVVIYSDLEDRMYKSIGLLSNEEQQIIKDNRSYEGIDLEPIQYQEVKNNLNIMEDVKVISLYDDVDGYEEILSISRVGHFPFFLVIEESTERYLSLVNNVATILSIIVSMAALITALIILLFLNKFIKPVIELRKVVQGISRGNLSMRADIKTGDEIEDLAVAFNTMASTMEKNIKNIEKEVAKRTKILKDLNSHMIGRELKMIELKKKLKNKK